MIAGLAVHFRTTLLLAQRSVLAWAMVLGAPLFILASFISLNRTVKSYYQQHVPLALAISLFGAACFSMPAALAAERERGIWRRYRLTPLPTAGFIAGSALAHLLIALAATAVQLAIAVIAHRLLFATWLVPAHPIELAVAVLVVGIAYTCTGLVLAMAAGSGNAVIGLGLTFYLPMLTIGGLGIPLHKMPEVVRHVSCFLPGRWGVDVINAALFKPAGLAGVGFSLGALAVLALTGAIAAVGLYRWEPDRPLGWRGWLWLAFAFASWVAVGLTAEAMGVPGQKP